MTRNCHPVKTKVHLLRSTLMVLYVGDPASVYVYIQLRSINICTNGICIPFGINPKDDWSSILLYGIVVFFCSYLNRYVLCLVHLQHYDFHRCCLCWIVLHLICGNPLFCQAWNPHKNCRSKVFAPCLPTSHPQVQFLTGRWLLALTAQPVHQYRIDPFCPNHPSASARFDTSLFFYLDQPLCPKNH
jgi:hypothetical protein